MSRAKLPRSCEAQTTAGAAASCEGSSPSHMNRITADELCANARVDFITASRGPFHGLPGGVRDRPARRGVWFIIQFCSQATISRAV
jgi:hypothetical protein